MEVAYLLLFVLCGLVNVGHCDCGKGVTRTRLSGDSGTITVPVSGDSYVTKSLCTWFIENDESASYMTLRISKFDIECLWDYLHIFAGDSVYDRKLAALSGNLFPETLQINMSDSNGGSGSMATPTTTYSPDGDIYIHSNSHVILLYFFSDVAAVGSGFTISYWTSSCSNNCSGRGYCDEDDGVCVCDSMWGGEYCQVPVCPSDCSGNGQCGGTGCVCHDGYTGSSCSIPTNVSHWVALDTNFTLGRAGHSAVVHEDYMWVYGGYQFIPDHDSSSYYGSGSGSGLIPDDDVILRYSLTDNVWEEVSVDLLMEEGPLPRYGHTAVVYEDAMFIYGGALIHNEEITNELWLFNFTTYTWTQQTDTLYNLTTDISPVPVKEHTAHVIGDKMVVLFGYSDISNSPINYTQEYHFETRTWSTPPQYGDLPSGHVGHTSTYVTELNTIYIYGGYHEDKYLVMSYDPTEYYWTYLIDKESMDNLVLHSTVYSDGFLLSFGGYITNVPDSNKLECTNDRVIVYDIVCNRVEVVPVQGLATNGSRYGHTAVATPAHKMLVYGGYRGLMHSDLIELHLGGCGQYDTLSSCVNDSVLCGWKGEQCVSRGLTVDEEMALYCDVDVCTIHSSCQSCVANNGCGWSEDSKCITPSNITLYITDGAQCPAYDVDCSRYDDSCQSCSSHEGCLWRAGSCSAGYSNGTVVCNAGQSLCMGATSCSSCSRKSSSCLWCDSTSICVPTSLYPHSFTYGQCLKWSDGNDKSFPCQDDCSMHDTCDACQATLDCGWCSDPEDTGIGNCTKGGFLAAMGSDSTCPDHRWYFDQCPACQCNGHSSCDDDNVCINCIDNTEGDNCENCIDGYWGTPLHGAGCSDCDCNGYNSICDNVMGNCTCLDSGVTGEHCMLCDASSSVFYRGDASIFCYYPLSVGFIYTFNPSDEREKQTFYVTVPDGGTRLNVKFDITQNTRDAVVGVQFFLGRASENFLLLYNLTDTLYIRARNDHSETFTSFYSDYNNTDLFTFSRGSLRHSINFTYLLGNVSSNEYTRHLWDGDLGLVIYVSNMTTPLEYKITVDQTDLLFLLYFFITFISCFTFLISIFFLGWYIKRKIQYRAFVRAQHIELQRRVRRPFTRVRVLAEDRPDISAKQNASYVAVETCRDTKAAVLTLLVRMPGDKTTGRPSFNRTGICFGSTLVKMNPQKKEKKKKSETRENNV